MSNMADGLNMLPRIGEPESNLIHGMAAAMPEGAQRLAGGLSDGGAWNMPDTSTTPPQPPGLNLQEPATWVYDFDPATGMSRATFNGVVAFDIGGGADAGVTAFNGRTGSVTLTAADLAAVGAAQLVDPSLEGNPTAPTAPAGDSSTTIATTAFVQQALASNPTVSSFNGRIGPVVLTGSDLATAGGALLASPAFTGTPTAPTPSLPNASGQLATTQFVMNAIGAGSVTSFNGRGGAVLLQLSDVTSVGGAPINAPNFTGVATGVTASPGTATTQLATTAFVTNAITGATTGVSSFNTRTGAITLQTSDIVSAGGAPLASPVLTGTPQAPTPPAGNASNDIATTQFVANALNAQAGVLSFNGRTGAVTFQLSDMTAVGGAPVNSPPFTGQPTAPTPTTGDNSTLLATTAFVNSEITAQLSGYATTAYVTANFAPLGSMPSPSSAAPLMDGTAAAGTAATFARGDHVHPTDTSRAAASALANYLPLTGGNITGSLGVNGSITAGGLNSTGAVQASGNITTGLNLSIQGGWLTYNPANGIFQLQTTSGSGADATLSLGGMNVGGTFNCNGALGGSAFSNLRAFALIGGTAGAGGAALVAYDGGNNPYQFWASFAGSDERIKTDIEPTAIDALKAILALPVRRFKQKGEPVAIGVVAQEVEPHVPEMVSVVNDARLPPDFRMVGYQPVVPYLIRAIQQLTARVMELEAAR